MTEITINRFRLSVYVDDLLWCESDKHLGNPVSYIVSSYSFLAKTIYCVDNLLVSDNTVYVLDLVFSE